MSDDDLRRKLSELADGWATSAYFARIADAKELRAALAAHPVASPAGHLPGCERFPTGWLCVADCTTAWHDDPPPAGQDEGAAIDAAHLANQRRWSEATFGPGTRLLGVLDHIRKELREIEAAPEDVEEWVDVIILAFDGAWRAGWEPQQIIDAIKAKQAKNEAREWPDWRTASPDHAIEHVRPAPAVDEEA